MGSKSCNAAIHMRGGTSIGSFFRFEGLPQPAKGRVAALFSARLMGRQAAHRFSNTVVRSHGS
jgi:2-methylaconitate cis-trans-isomerase PrpF